MRSSKRKVRSTHPHFHPMELPVVAHIQFQSFIVSTARLLHQLAVDMYPTYMGSCMLTTLYAGLQRTDNNMEFTTWPQVPMINQKNYYTYVHLSSDRLVYSLLATT